MLIASAPDAGAGREASVTSGAFSHQGGPWPAFTSAAPARAGGVTREFGQQFFSPRYRYWNSKAASAGVRRPAALPSSEEARAGQWIWGAQRPARYSKVKFACRLKCAEAVQTTWNVRDCNRADALAFLH
jgi:hypothetical protein